MPEPSLESPDVDARFEPRGRKRVPQRMDACARRHPGGPLGVRRDCLGRRNGPGGGRSLGGKQPRRWAVPLPGGAQLAEEARREQSLAVLTTLALLDAEQQTIPLDVRALAADARADPQPCGIGRHA